MSKRSFNEIEQAIKTAAEANEPAFDEQAWKKMEALLDKEEDRKRPYIFWIWWLLPLMMGAGVAGYFVFNNTDKQHRKQETALKYNDKTAGQSTGADNLSTLAAPNPGSRLENDNENLTGVNTEPGKGKGKKENNVQQLTVNAQKGKSFVPTESALETNDALKRREQQKNVKGKMTVSIKATNPGADDESNESELNRNNPGEIKKTAIDIEKKEEIVVIKIDADKTNEKQIEKLVDSVAEKISTDDKTKNKIVRLYIVVAAGAEANGVKLFSADKITSRFGLGIGYQINKNISVQTGFYVSNKKYGAAGSDYKIKAGSYWSTVNIKTIEANCKVYEIPFSVFYNFTPGKRLNIFASAGLSSYIMKKEDYLFYYDHYGTAYQAAVNYKGNKNLFSVLRLSAGIEKKISRNFSVIASPGIAIPLSGVGEGEVKLYSTDITIGLKFTPFQKK